MVMIMIVTRIADGPSIIIFYGFLAREIGFQHTQIIHYICKWKLVSYLLMQSPGH